MSKQCLILVDTDINGTRIKCGSVVQVCDECAEKLVKAGVADAQEAAVKNALDNGAEVIVLETEKSVEEGIEKKEVQEKEKQPEKPAVTTPKEAA